MLVQCFVKIVSILSSTYLVFRLTLSTLQHLHITFYENAEMSFLQACT